MAGTGMSHFFTNHWVASFSIINVPLGNDLRDPYSATRSGLGDTAVGRIVNSDGCGGPLRTESTIAGHSLPQRTDPLWCV